MARDRYNRDPGVAEILEYFDQPEHCAWHLLTDSEAEILHKEIAKCEDPDTGFPYISRNYYWITTKEGSDVLLRFKDTQEMVWETVRLLRLRGKAVRIMIIKGRQLYVTSFSCGLLAYETQFNPNNRGLLVSYDEDHAGRLFQDNILHIYAKLPWWLSPMIGAKKYEEGILLENPDFELRRLEPGMNSRITVQGANQNVGVAEGTTINTAAVSEFGSWDPAKARKVIIGDFRWALPDSPTTTAILETRVQRNARFAERLWESQVELGDDAMWFPLFIPVYFDRTHFIAPKPGWKPDEPEAAVKKRAEEEWRVCSHCGQIRPSNFGGVDLEGVPCRDCKQGIYVRYNLQDGQMNWLRQQRVNAEKMGTQAVSEMQQSLATNPQEAFASVTESVFSKKARDWVASTTRGECLARGYMAPDGTFHAPRRIESGDRKSWGQETAQCFSQGCKEDHRGDTNRFVKIWQPPIRGVRYVIGGDVGSGLGGVNDFSVAWVNRIGDGPEPDIQVAFFRSNTISAWNFAQLLNSLGRWYNDALMVVDYTNEQTTGDRLYNEFNYPNLYRWRNPDSLSRVGIRIHWVWNVKNRNSWQTVNGYLEDHALIVKEPTFAKEMRHYEQFEDGSVGSREVRDKEGLGDSFEKIHDDTVTCLCQMVVACHQDHPRRKPVLVDREQDGLSAAPEWLGTCGNCSHSFAALEAFERDKCPNCGSCRLRWKMNGHVRPDLGFNYEDMGMNPGQARGQSRGGTEFSFGDSSGGNDFYGQR